MCTFLAFVLSDLVRTESGVANKLTCVLSGAIGRNYIVTIFTNRAGIIGFINRALVYLYNLYTQILYREIVVA